MIVEAFAEWTNPSLSNSRKQRKDVHGIPLQPIRYLHDCGSHGKVRQDWRAGTRTLEMISSPGIDSCSSGSQTQKVTRAMLRQSSEQVSKVLSHIVRLSSHSSTARTGRNLPSPRGQSLVSLHSVEDELNSWGHTTTKYSICCMDESDYSSLMSECVADGTRQFHLIPVDE